MSLLDNANRFDSRSYLLCWLFVLFCIPPIATAEPFFKPFTASFRVYRSALPLGDLELKFNLSQDGNYRYHAHTMPGLLAGLFSGDEVIEESHGWLNQERVTPLRYLYQLDDGDEENTQVLFDWPDKEVHTTSKGVTWSQPIEPNTQDRLSQQLLVRLELSRGSENLEYRVADGGRIKRYRFQVVSRETVKTPYGHFDCLRVERSKESRPPDYTIWFAPALDYLPVRIERQQRGNQYRMVLDELKGFEFPET
ncbi:MAG: DUF3108 domain-containing protein [Candidatus Thiodiazotropha sp. (ex Monitilora ramsayi)]|nr:DUF3108 domain-containing protein [Candidatus Thiodiazotropha sp. (ex Monitilora ramsayi)]